MQWRSLAQRRRMAPQWPEEGVADCDSETIKVLGAIERLPERVDSTCINCGVAVHWDGETQEWWHDAGRPGHRPVPELHCFPNGLHGLGRWIATPQAEHAGGSLWRRKRGMQRRRRA